MLRGGCTFTRAGSVSCGWGEGLWLAQDVALIGGRHVSEVVASRKPLGSPGGHLGTSLAARPTPPLLFIMLSFIAFPLDYKTQNNNLERGTKV